LDASFLSVIVCFGAELSVQTHLDASFLSATVCFSDELSVKKQMRFNDASFLLQPVCPDFQIYDDHHHA
jgi:hypothetical protein